VPMAGLIAVLVNPTNPNSAPQLKDLQSAARTLGQQIVVLEASSKREIDAAFATMAQHHVGALLVTADGFLIGQQDQLVALAAGYALPAMYPLSKYVVAGGLISYVCEPHRWVSSTWQLYRAYPQGGKTRKSASDAADDVRAGSQSQDCACARS